MARGIIDAVGKAPSVSEGAFFRFLGRGDVMRSARRFPAGAIVLGFMEWYFRVSGLYLDHIGIVVGRETGGFL